MGLDLGLERAGLECLAANEIDKWALATIRANRPGLCVFDRDVRSIRPSDFAGLEPFAVVGGPPCQSFSTAGKRQGLNDPRGNAFLSFLDLAVAMQPQYVVIENVRGLLSAPLLHRPHALRDSPLTADESPGGALRLIVSMLEDAGYGVSFQLYNVANFGVPQVRERLVLIACSGGVVAPHLAPTHAPGEWVSFRSAVEGLRHGDECAAFRNGRAAFFERVGEGENWRALPVELQRQALGKAYESSGGRVGFCRRISWDKPSPTLVTCPTMPATELGHPVEMRPLSVAEYRRLQTFPDDWTVCGPLSAKYRQLGNAVPVLFGEAIGRHLLALASGSRIESVAVPASRYRGTDESSWRRRTA